jgi:glycosyltransferase involved in cell wall biosynthesis
MIVHVFNSSLVSGPETLVLPSLSTYKDEAVVIIFLSETRCGERSKAPPAYARSYGLEVIEIEVRSRWDKLAVAELLTTLKKLSPRIVHAHEVKASAYVVAASPTERQYSLITTNHGVRAKKALTLKFYEWIFTHLIMRKFDRVLCVCSSDREIIIRRGVPSRKVFVHLNGVDRPKIAPGLRYETSQKIRKSWGLDGRGIPAGALCLGVVGRLAPEKRHSFILATFKKLSAKIDAHLLIFGTGPLDSVLAAESTQLGLEGKVHWMGYRNGVGAEIAGLDVLVSLSSAEGLPINLIEAGWAGTSVFATAVDGNLDLIPSPEYGTLVQLEEQDEVVAEKLYRMVSDQTALQATGVNLQNRIDEQFSGKVWMNRLKELYNF